MPSGYCGSCLLTLYPLSNAMSLEEVNRRQKEKEEQQKEKRKKSRDGLEIEIMSDF